jgi:hypothetical protein
MNPKSQVANALLRGSLPSREVAGVVFEEAEIETPVAMRTAPSFETVRRHAKRNWVRAATAVLSGVPEYIGPAVYRHKSATVRRLYATHGTDAGTLQELVHYATGSSREARAWANKVDLKWLQTWIVGLEESPEAIWLVLGERMMREAQWEPRFARRLAADQREYLCAGALSVAVRAGDREGAGRILASAGALRMRREVCCHVYENHDGELHELLLDLLHEVHKQPGDVLEFLKDSGFECKPVGSQTLEKIISSMPDGAISVLGEETIFENLEMFLARPSFEIVNWLVVHACAAVDEGGGVRTIPHAALEQALAGLNRVPVVPGRALSENILANWPEPLSDAAVLQALRHGDAENTWEWLAGEGASVPNIGVFRQLNEKPGIAFRRSWEDDPLRENERVNYEQFLLKGYADIGGLVQQPDADEIIEIMGSPALMKLLQLAGDEHASWSDTAVSDYLTRRFTEHLGEDPEAWRLALQVVGSSTQALGRTLRGVQKLHRAGRSQS